MTKQLDLFEWAANRPTAEVIELTPRILQIILIRRLWYGLPGTTFFDKPADVILFNKGAA